MLKLSDQTHLAIYVGRFWILKFSLKLNQGLAQSGMIELHNLSDNLSNYQDYQIFLIITYKLYI